jgi:hypothetical protein
MGLIVTAKKFQEEPIVVIHKETGEVMEIRIFEGRNSTRNTVALAFYDPSKNFQVSSPQYVTKHDIEYDSTPQKRKGEKRACVECQGAPYYASEDDEGFPAPCATCGGKSE